MKALAIINIIIFATSTFCYAQVLENPASSVVKFRNKIDNIKTDTDVDKLLDSIDRKRFEVFIVKEKLEIKNQKCKELAGKVQAKSWSKVDFDNNGYTDILIIGDDFGLSSIVVLDKGKNDFVIKNLTGGMFRNCAFPVVQNVEPQPLIIYHSANESETKTLIYKFGDFVEVNKSPQKYNIQKIEYKTPGCYGTCPIFEMNIDSDRSATYKPIAFNKKQKGFLKGKIQPVQLGELFDLLNYIDFPNLQSDYSVGGTDQQSAYLTITYDGGKVKNIADYGLRGTFALSRAYQILFEFRENQTWK
ncbi:MAG: DUF6438 domain-containing protein [Pyrinomonadaceae bacterium]